MKSLPLISIIIPVYNASNFIEKTIENLIEQEVDKEIILINDGSTDNSLEVLRNIENKYKCIRVINQINKGVSAARNTGIDSAKGNYILFIDSDDLLEKDTLKKLLSKYQTFDCDLVLCSYKICYDNDSIIDNFKYFDSGLYKIDSFLTEYYKLYSTKILHCIGTKLYKKSIIDKYHIRFNESLAYYEDINFCISYLNRTNTIYYINESLYKYMQINVNSLASKYKSNFPEISSLTLTAQRDLLETIYGNINEVEDFQKIILEDFYSGIANEINNQYIFKNKYLNIKKLVLNEDIGFVLKHYNISSKSKIKRTIIKSRNPFLILCSFELSKFFKKIIK